MKRKIQLLDCTLRDGAYIVDANFGTPAIKGIIKRLQEASVDIIECGWLKNFEHKKGTTFYHVPKDLEPYLLEKTKDVTYVVMIDWDRYNLENLPKRDGNSIDAVRVVFPHGKHKEGIAVGNEIKEKGYDVFYQAANTLAYSDEELYDLAYEINKVHPVALSVVDTFGAMYEEDLERIVGILDRALDKDIKLGFHSHNNQQLSFALTMRFVELLKTSGRNCIVDSSLCGMGRGAGNATTELVVNYLNRKHSGGYDMNQILDAIDMYMGTFQENYDWGYSIPYFIAGMYCCHVNNIAYLLKNHRTNARDMHNVIESLDAEDRKKYDYDLLEEKYLENQNRIIDDEGTINALKKRISGQKILLIAPGKTSETDKIKILSYIQMNKPVIIEVNAVNPNYEPDYLFVVNTTRYDYAKEIYPDQFQTPIKILLSNIKTVPDEKELIINFNRVVKRGWEHFDNAVINCLRLMDKLKPSDVAVAGFDGFKHKYNESYADFSLPTLNPDNKWDELNEEIKEMYKDFKNTKTSDMKIHFITESIFAAEGEEE